MGRKSTKMTAEIKLVTPAMAKRLLKGNIHNRKLDIRRVGIHAETMKRGQWMENGDPIQIDKDGHLLNGQHRLHAIMQSKKSFRMPVVTNLDPKVFTTIDINKTRTLANAMQMAGIKNHNVFSIATRYITTWNLGYSEVKFLPIGTRKRQKQYAELIQFYRKNEKALKEIHDRIRKFDPHTLRPISVAKAVAMAFYVKKKDKNADSYIYDFFQDFISGTKKKKSDVPRLLCKRFIVDKASTSRIKTGVQNQMLLSAIKSYKKGSRIKHIRIPKDNLFKQKTI